MSWIETSFSTPEGELRHICINLDHVRAVRANPEGKAIVLSSTYNVGAMTLLDSYDNIVGIIRRR